jgi:hypothetical protein
MKLTDFWDVTSCDLVDLHCSLFDPEDGDSKFLRNVGEYISDYTATHPRRK